MNAYDTLPRDEQAKVDRLLADTAANGGLAPVDLDAFWRDQAIARKDPFAHDAPQCCFGASLMETIVASIQDRLRLGRFHACLVALAMASVLAVPSALGYGRWAHVKLFRGMAFLDFFDFVSNSVLMPIAAFATCVFVGWVAGPKLVLDEASIPTPFRHRRLFVAMIRYIAPLLLVAILVTSVLVGLDVIAI